MGHGKGVGVQKGKRRWAMKTNKNPQASGKRPGKGKMTHSVKR